MKKLSDEKVFKIVIGIVFTIFAVLGATLYGEVVYSDPWCGLRECVYIKVDNNDKK